MHQSVISQFNNAQTHRGINNAQTHRGIRPGPPYHLQLSTVVGVRILQSQVVALQGGVACALDSGP